MNFSKKSIWWIVITAILLFSLSSFAEIFFSTEMNWQQKIWLSLIVIVYFAFHWLAVIWISFKLQKQYPHARQDWNRLIKTYLLSASVIVITMIIMDGISNTFEGEAFQLSLSELLFDIFQGMGIAILIVSLAEASYQYRKNQRSERENAELIRVNLLAQYNNLKQQVNPHFLFNSLNTLSSLISIDPQRAETFVEELSFVYRYLLQTGQHELVKISQELNFLCSYIHLIKTRFGNGLDISINIPDEYHHYLMPPLSLQMLVENAVKHNEISVDKPLKIELYLTAAEQIEVSNNLQEKSVAMPSEKVGLVNIITKYRLLGQGEVVILKTATHFKVSLPLIKSTTHESIDY